MFVDRKTIPHNADISFDLCIMGGGAAGITLAREFSGTPFRICLLESGGFDFDADVQKLYEGRSEGLHYPTSMQTRLRYFGGSTNHWGGFCGPLDAFDFSFHSWIPLSGWPLERHILDPWYARAHGVCELGPFDYDVDRWLKRNGDAPFQWPNGLHSMLWQFSIPTRFGTRYRAELEDAPNISIFLNTSLIEIEQTEAAHEVSSLLVGSLDGHRFRIKARYFVLACGGIENARLLLSSRQKNPKGIGNTHDWVGRTFMDHPHGVAAEMMLIGTSVLPKPLFLETDISGTTVMAGLELNPDIQERERLSRVSLSIRKNQKSLDDFGRAVLQVEDDFTDEAIGMLDRYSVFFKAEHTPKKESRVTLDPTQRDALGMPRVVVRWLLEDIDLRSVLRTVEILDDRLRKTKRGRVYPKKWLKEQVRSGTYIAQEDHRYGLSWGAHHLGTTRMSSSPTQGVVTPDLRLHDVENLYIAGSSVFPTSGSMNPTLTIVALTLRLAEHLRDRLEHG